MVRGRREASVRIPFTSAELAHGLKNALEPETESTPEEKFLASVSIEDNIICLSFGASTTQKLRAALSSYIRWVLAIQDVHKVVEEFK